MMDIKTEGTSDLQAFPAGEVSSENTASYISEEYRQWQMLFDAQPRQVQHQLEAEARHLAEAMIHQASHIMFHLVSEVITAGESNPLSIPNELSQQAVGGFSHRLTRTGVGAELRRRLDVLEASPNLGAALSAGLLRYATATYLVHQVLPAGRTVRYQSLQGEEIPTVPVSGGEVDSAITNAGDVIAVDEELPEGQAGDRVAVPFSLAARGFFLPQWVAFDDQDRLLVRSEAEAESYLASMQRYVNTLHMAISLAPYMLADEDYRQKRYGMLGQLINQGRALARFEVNQVIATIRRRVAAGNLNRGLSLSLPYFDSQDLVMKTREFTVIPAGRVMFVPAFVVLAARREQAKVVQDTRLDRATRTHLFGELRRLEKAFKPSAEK